MESLRLAASIRALRRRRRWTQAQLAGRVGLSRQTISRLERGHGGGLTLETVERIVEACEARLTVRVLWRGEEMDRLLDRAHAALVETTLALLRTGGWESAVEATFSIYGERGAIDVLAWHPRSGSLLVIEVKSVVPDLQGMLAPFDRKVRLAPRVAADRGWRASSVSRVLVLPDDRTARRRVTDFEATFARVLPARTREVRRWLRDPAGTLAGVLFLPDSRDARARRRSAGASSRIAHGSAKRQPEDVPKTPPGGHLSGST